MSHRSILSSWRPALITLLLLATLAVSGGLAYQALQAQQEQQATAEAVLQQYASFAAEQFAQRCIRVIEYRNFFPLLTQLVNLKKSGPVDPKRLARVLTTDGSFAARAFEIDWLGQTVRIGPTPFPGGNRELLETLQKHTQESCTPKAPYCTMVAAGYLLVYKPEFQGATAAGSLGFEVEGPAFHNLLKQVFDDGPLLPPSLTQGKLTSPPALIRVYGPGGSVLYQAAGDFSKVLGEAHLSSRLGSLRVEAAIPSAIRGRLFVGAQPHSRFPLLVGLLILTAGLVLVAILLLRQEQELTRLRSDFISSVSHELRTPLAQIRLFSETLLLNRVRSEEERLSSLEIIHQEAQRLSNLVENVLQFSRLERKLLKLTPEDTQVATLVAEVVEAFSPLALSHNCEVRLEEIGPVRAAVDPEALKHILLNLLDNAVKHGPQGQVIRVRLGSTESRLRLEVEDEGPGIPPDDRDRIWDRFYRSSTEGGTATGTGIGLAVVKELVMDHQGTVAVKPGAGGGACFVVTLPRGEAVPQTPKED